MAEWNKLKLSGNFPLGVKLCILQKCLSDAQLDTLRKIPCKFQLNPFSRLGGVVRTRFFDFEDLRTYLRTDGKNFCQVHN